MKEVKLLKGRERSVLRRHPWIFSGAISEAPENLGVGETVRVVSAAGAFLGWGWYSPASQLRVRMVSYTERDEPTAAWLERRIQAVIAHRGIWQAKRARRLIHSESDYLPGITLDRYDNTLVCQLTSAGAEANRETLVAALKSAIPEATALIERRDVDARRKEGLLMTPEAVALFGDLPTAPIEIEENAIRYQVDVLKGHKTGFYLDQRDARLAVSSLAKGKEVLNCFCYTGGFGLAALRGGAVHVTQVDVSADALALAKSNGALNGFPETAHELVEADVFAYLRGCRDRGQTFDLIVLDPPKFAETKSQVMKAARGYKDINLLALKLLRPGGTLVTFSCSGAISREFFETILREAALDAGRACQIIGTTRQADDHPVALDFPEGLYLKGLILRLA